MSAPSQPSAVIDIKASYFFLSFLLALFKPKASINGTAPFPIRWGETPVPVPPGRYQVEVFVPYLFLPTMGRNGVVVDVPEGGRIQVHWRAPLIVFTKGSVSVAGPAPLAAAVPSAAMPSAAPAAQASGAVGWHADPSGRQELRYYDGTRWTEHVSTGGLQATDPLGER